MRTSKAMIAVLGLGFACLVGCKWPSWFGKKTDEVGSTAEQKEGLPVKTFIETQSGLKYQILNEGAGTAQVAHKNNFVQVHYTGWLADESGNPLFNKKFDSSVDRNKPFAFRLGARMVIAGWDEGVEGMRVGEKRRLILPPHLGYGARGAGNLIPANATLVFDVELLNVS